MKIERHEIVLLVSQTMIVFENNQPYLLYILTDTSSTS